MKLEAAIKEYLIEIEIPFSTCSSFKDGSPHSL